MVPLEKMFPSQETSFQGSSLLDLSTLEPIQRKKFSTGPLFIRASRELLLLCLVTELVTLWESAVGRSRMSSNLDVTEN